MPVKLGIELSTTTRLRVQHELRDIRNGFPRALSTSVNRTAKTATSKISQAVRGEITVNKASADKRLKIRGRATPNNPTSVVRIERGSYSGRPSPLITSFRGTKDTRVYSSGKRAGEIRRRKSGSAIRGSGITARPRVGGGTQQIKHGFIARGTGGVMVPYVRQYESGKKRFGRKPLFALTGPSVLGVYANKPGLKEGVEKELSGVLEKNLLSQADRLLKRSR